MIEHTPGPWVIKPVSAMTRLVYGDGIHVATVYAWSHGQPPEALDANARLIAVAPELLAACEAAYHKLVIAHPHDGGRGENPDNPLPRQLKAAIDGAKGDE